jgi:mono/diheme cytochrome c family protein
MHAINKVLASVIAVALLAPFGAGAAETKKVTVDLQKGYQLAKKRCTSCHDSVANPEAGKMTRDEWIVVIDVMHKQFKVKMNNNEQEQLIDYFYTIRKGLEKEAG